MKTFSKSLLTASLLLAANALYAADVTIYGLAHLSVDHLDNGVDSGTNISSNASRLGFRAKTELEGGLEAFVQLEQTIRYDEGAGSFADRDSYVGLRGSFGTIKLGQFDTPLKIIRGKVDLFGDRVGDIRNVSRVNAGTLGNVFDERFKNGISYESKTVNNLSFAFHYTPHNNTGATVDNVRESYSSSISYERKGLYLAAAIERFEGTDGLDPQAIRLGAFYDVTEQFRLTTLLQSAKDIPGGDRNTYGLGASYKQGNYTWRGQVYQTSDNDTADTGATLLAVGVDRNFGRDLILYAVYGITSNDDNAAYRVSGGGRGTQLAAVTGEDNSGLSLGIIYRF
ncbi:porin [Alishewanella longhuensis]|uniref:Porin n=1 Tax=Alishewanella longhuensis TaxID=1091037 RepID=A0ABQ3KZA6_9ALTE|nr:porin [Alishewanella longhuensis]GHG71202.1 porin [Alishewanella longhuensis]